MVGYLILIGGLQLKANLERILKGKSHFMIPLGLTALMMFDNRNTKIKTSLLLKESKNLPSIDIAMRKFLCDTTQIERIQIFRQS